MNPRYSLGAVRMLLAEPNHQVRSSYRSVLFRYGLRGIDDSHSGQQTHDIITDKHYDLAVLDADMEDCDVLASVRSLREGKIGKDPFTNVILIADPPNSERARQLLNSGADSILVRPLSVETLRARIDLLIEKRRPFVVTHDYIGPEKRTEQRPDAGKIAEVRVPSGLRDRAYGKTQESHHFKAVAETWEIVKQHRIECQVFQLGWVASRVQRQSNTVSDGASMARLVKQLAITANGLADWLTEKTHPELHAACIRLKDGAVNLSQAAATPDPHLIQTITAEAQTLVGLWRGEPNKIAVSA